MPDKCSCGSGKKEGSCCGEKNNVIDLNRYRWWRAGQQLRKHLAEFADNDAFFDEAEVARESFFSVIDPELVDEDDDFLLERFFEWFIFDYHIGDRSLLEYYGLIKELGIEEKELVNKWKDARSSVYQVTVVNKNDSKIVMNDLLCGGELEVYDRNAARELESGHIMLMRILPVGNEYEFSTGGLILPSHSKNYVISRIKLDAELYWNSNGGSNVGWGDWNIYLRERAHVLNALIMETSSFVWDLPADSKELNERLLLNEKHSSKLAQQVTDVFLDYFYERWLHEPMDVLQGKTPLEASRTKSGRQKLQTLLRELEKVEVARKQKGEPFYDLTRLWQRLHLPKDIALLKPDKRQHFKQFGTDDTGVNKLIRQGMIKLGYRTDQAKSAIEIWQKYNEIEHPTFKKPEVWAAAVIYTVAKLLGDKTVSQNELARMFNISASTISLNYKNICHVLQTYENNGSSQDVKNGTFLAKILSTLKT